MEQYNQKIVFDDTAKSKIIDHVEGQRAEGRKIVDILTTFKIPKSTYYYWLKEVKTHPIKTKSNSAHELLPEEKKNGVGLSQQEPPS